MFNYKVLLNIILWVLIAVGIIGVIPVSYTTYFGTHYCPSIGGVYICYVVLLGYALMLTAQFMPKTIKKYKTLVFYGSWTVVFSIALFGVVFEIIQGDVCPRSSTGIPLCYYSLLLTISILLLYKITQKVK